MLAVLGVVAWFFYNPAGMVVSGVAVGSLATAIGTALIHLLVLVAKSVMFCWVWIWVRWTLPRFRYDHVMHLAGRLS